MHGTRSHLMICTHFSLIEYTFEERGVRSEGGEVRDEGGMVRDVG